MADISILSRLVNGFQRNVDVSQNSLVVGSIKIGSSTPVEITKAIATKLIAVQAAADADGTFDTRYHTKTALAANGGAALIGGSTGQTVEQRLLNVEAAVGTGSAADISFDPTGTSLTATDVQELGVELDSRVQATEAVANAAIPATEKGANNGVATLDGAGKVPLSQLPNSIMEYKGTWDADTNTPALSNGSGNAGDVWRVTVAGTHDFGAGPISFEIGDYAIYNAAGEYEKADTTDAVSSVNGQQGAVILDTDDIQEGSTNLYHTDERAQDAVGAMVQDSDTISLTYDDGTPSLVAEVKDNSIDENKLTTSVADQKTITGGNGSALAVQEAPKESRSMTAGESMADDVTFAVRLALDGETAARVYKADNDATTDNKFFAIGLCRKVGGASAGDPVDVIRSGPYELGANDTPFNAADIGKPVYLGSAGALTVTPPSSMNSAAYRVGFVENTTIVMVDRQLHGIN